MAVTGRIAECIRAALARNPGARIIVAYSGGLDSTVLLHASVHYGDVSPSLISAVHIDHGLADASRHWAAECRKRAEELGVACEIRTVTTRPDAGASVEAWARHVRYSEIEAFIESGDVVVTAHHRDDLAETFLLQLMRGAGPDGLAGIPLSRPLGRGTLVRPMLEIRRSEIVAYGEHYGLTWIDDPGNSDESFDRNFIRHRVIPLLRERWPAASDRIAHAASLQRESATLLNRAADAALAEGMIDEDGNLDIALLRRHDPAERHRIVRRWLKQRGLPMPDTVHLHEIERMCTARVDANPVVEFKRTVIRRYRARLYVERAREVATPSEQRDWDLSGSLELPDGELKACSATGVGIARAALRGAKLSIRFRRGGERCRPVGRGHSCTLKHLYQEWAVPPWRRNGTPLLYADEKLVAVADFCVCEPFAAAGDEAGIRLVWTARK